MSNKQSSVDWLYEKLFHCEINIFEWQHYLEQAKAMHKEEVFDAYDAGVNLEYDLDMPTPREYYNETYGGNK